MQEAVQEVREGKNIGKSNETSVLEQALSQAKSMWNKKRDQNYAESGDTKRILLPMLAQQYEKRRGKIIWPVFIQPKLNGVRCLAKKVSDTEIEFTSRKGKRYETLKHIGESLLDCMKVGEVFDGEVYNTQLTLQEILSRVKNVKGSGKKKARSEKRDFFDQGYNDAEELQFHAYDCINSATYAQRLEHLRQALTNADPSKIVFTHTALAQTHEDVKLNHDRFVSEGYEGIMVRSPKSLYRCDYRSPDLLKYKEFVDDDFLIVGGKSGTGKDAETVIFTVVTTSGQSFDVRPKGSWELRNHYWKNLDKYIGKMLTVRYQELTDDGIPRFGVGIAVDDDK